MRSTRKANWEVELLTRLMNNILDWRLEIRGKRDVSTIWAMGNIKAAHLWRNEQQRLADKFLAVENNKAITVIVLLLQI